jgi:hypothetical protein
LDVSDEGEVPKSTREVACTLVDHVIWAELLVGIAATAEIAGGALSGVVVKLAGPVLVGGEVELLFEASTDVTRK